MVKYQRKNMFSQWKKAKDYYMADDEDDESDLDPSGLISGNSPRNNKRAKPKLLFLVLLSLISCSLILEPLLLSSNSTSPLLHSSGTYKEGLGSETDAKGSLCSSVPNGTICCDRSSIRSDICIMRGDVRTHPTSSSITLYRTNDLRNNSEEVDAIHHQKIRPYTRKWEATVMETVDELDLIVQRNWDTHHRCDVQHQVPAVFFSTGGYTGNLYHEFNDGILPLYITSQHLNKKVVFVVLEYHNWWMTKYHDILSQLSDFPAVDFSGDKRIHCFPEAIVGLRIHNELSINASLMEGNKDIGDFHDLLDRAYSPRVRGLIQEEEHQAHLIITNSGMSASSAKATATALEEINKPKLVIVFRNGSRAITNEDLLVKMAESIGFLVEVLRPQRTTELASIYRALNSSKVMIGVHGAAMTHFLFMRPGSVFIQVIPLGTDWAAETYYGKPARKFGLRYIGYKILAKESSLYDAYNKGDPILKDPSSVNLKGWEFTKKIYLDHQTVRLNLGRFRKRLLRAYNYFIDRKNGGLRRRQSQ